jgi:hypothetical protein
MLALLMAVASTAVTLGTGAPAHAANGFSWPIRNDGTGKCLEPAGRSMVEGAPIVQQPCDGSLAQDWGFVSLGGNAYRLLNHLTGFCIEATGNAVNGTSVVQWVCATVSNDTWDTGRPPPDSFRLTSRVSGTSSHCLDVPGGQAVDGLAMQLYACNNTAAQRWLVGVGVIRQ